MAAEIPRQPQERECPPRDYGSYRGGVRFETALPDDEAIFYTGREKGVYDYERALDVLLVCSLTRRKK